MAHLLAEDRDRQTVPRWRSYGYAIQLGELEPSSQGKTRGFRKEILKHIQLDWQENPSLSVACDLVSAAFSVGLQDQVEGAANFILAHDNAPPLAIEIATRCLPSSSLEPNREFVDLYFIKDVDAIKSQIGVARQFLRAYPQNPMLWTNLALMYTVLGRNEKAENAIKVGSSLAPNDRFVTRAASRFYLHQGDLERAHDILCQSSLLPVDPWISASEIAVAQAANRSPVSTIKGRRLLESQNFSPSHLSELASSIATLEARNGKTKKAKKLCNQSLIAPVENSIAQIAWLERNVGGVTACGGIPHGGSNEADAWREYTSSNWKESLDSTRAWQMDQPFSSRPAILGGFIASTVFEDFNEAKQILEIGYAGNRDDVTLLNNLAFCYAKLGDVAKAGDLVRHAENLNMARQSQIALTATKGLVAFRTGNPELGRQLYEQAIGSCNENESRLAIVAKVYLGIEEQRLGGNRHGSIFDAVLSQIQRLPHFERELFVKKVTEK